MENRAGETLFYNGNILTVDAAMPRASVMGVAAGKIVYAGDSRTEAAARLSPDAATVDLRGHTMTPGFTDSHQHFMLQGLSLTELDCRLKTREDILRLVAIRARELRPGEWILGRGWNHELWPGRRWPCKAELDTAAPNNPVALTRLDGHSLWVNSRTLETVGLGRDSPEYPGGEMLRAPDGELTGILIDAPTLTVRQAVPPQTAERMREACLLAQAEMFRYGVTSVGDAWQTPEEHALLGALYREGKLRIRIYGMLSSRMREKTSRAAAAPTPVAGLYGDRLALRAYKMVLDGSLGSRSAWLTDDYADRPNHRGSRRYTDKDMLARARSARDKGFQLCIHAIGDAAVLQALGAFETLARDETDPRLPHRIEHFQIAAPGTVARALKLGVILSMQTSHAAADREMAQARLSPRDLRRSYPWREILDQGGIIANGSDSPMDGANPFHGFHAAITRAPFAGDTPNEAVRMTRDEALKSYTVWAARAEMAEGRKGSLTVGKHADCIVLDRDIMTCPEEKVKETGVLLTMVAGEIVFGGPDRL